MKKVIIGIHGLNNKPSERLLKEWWKQSMTEGLVSIGKYQSLPLFELIYWADLVYEKPLNPDITDKNDPYYLDEIYTPSTTYSPVNAHAWRLKAADFINKYLRRIFLNTDFSLKKRNVVDSILQRYFQELDTYYKEECHDENCIHCKTRKAIIERIISILKKYEHDDICLIGHSMGSILAFDTICFEIPQIKISTFLTIGSPLGLPVVISKIASRQHKSQDVLSNLKTPSSIIKRWHNYSDIDDVIAINYKLNAEFAENDKGIKPIDTLIRNNYEMNGKRNPHNVYGYLRSKAFSEALAEFIQDESPSFLQRTFSGLRNVLGKAGNLLNPVKPIKKHSNV